MSGIKNHAEFAAFQHGKMGKSHNMLISTKQRLPGF